MIASVAEHHFDNLLQRWHHIDVDDHIKLIATQLGNRVDRHWAQHRTHPHANRRVITLGDVDAFINLDGGHTILLNTLNIGKGDITDAHGLVITLQHKVLQAQGVFAVILLGNWDGGILGGRLAIDNDFQLVGIVGGQCRKGGNDGN